MQIRQTVVLGPGQASQGLLVNRLDTVPNLDPN
jgi:hypothetical protein